MTLPLEDYAMIGDCETAALVGRDGSIDWLCWPRFDGDACFAALLGGEENGRWLIGPADPSAARAVSRRYRGDSLILETRFESERGAVVVIDVMPPRDGESNLLRIVVGERGTMEMRTDLVIRFGYGARMPWVHRLPDRSLRAIAGADQVVLRTPVELQGDDGRTVGTFTVSAGETVPFALSYAPSHLPPPDPRDPLAGLAEAEAFWSEWSGRACPADGREREIILRSLITLKGLTYAPTGGIVAAPTTSLPETLGGTRNWDYRYCWLRDATLTLLALMNAGYYEEAAAWRDWLLRAVAGDPEDLQIMYTVDGGRHLPERELEHLNGYEGSRPVRIGNGAVEQRQTDVLGEVMSALQLAREAGIKETADSWAMQRTLVNELGEHWDEPDNGLWEIRGPRRHFTHSRVMVWVAFDRAVQAIEKHGLDGPLQRWRELRDEVHAEVMDKGYDAERNTFTQHYETTEVDASLLVLSAVGFIAGDDPKMLGTIQAVERDLMTSGLLMRYRTETGVDGLSGKEHPFLACSFWLVSAYTRAGRTDDAVRLMHRLLGLANDVGLLSEEYDVEHDRMAGNFPQAFSHLALVGAAMTLLDARRD